MVKKVSKTFTASLNKNDVKGGAWMAIVTVTTEGIEGSEVLNMAAWANASAGKRWIKEQVQSLTPRKSVKMVAGDKVDAKNKPTTFTGSVAFKA